MKKKVKKSSPKKRVSKYREFLVHNRFHGTINKKRKEVTNKLDYYVKVIQGKPISTTVPGVQYIGLKNLDPVEVQTIVKLTKSAHKRLLRDFPKLLLLVDVKKHPKLGKRDKFTVRLRLEGTHSVVLSAKQADWDLRKALQKTISNLEQEIKHKFKRENTKRRPKIFR